MEPIFLNGFIRAFLQKTLNSGYFSTSSGNANRTLTKVHTIMSPLLNDNRATQVIILVIHETGSP